MVGVVPDNVDVLKTTGLDAVKWFKWWILCYVNVTSYTRKFNELVSSVLAI